MTNTKRISVIMPVYNANEEHLRLSIESILNQSFKDFEFIIINDGSTNNSESVILSYQDERIRYIKQENAGIAKTLNRGLELATGEFIARMDSDDISLETRFEKQVTFLDTHKDISLVGSWIELMPKPRVIRKKEYPLILDNLMDCCVAHPSVMFRKNDFEKYDLKYDPTYKCEDYELWSRALMHLRFANIQEVLLKYRINENGLSQTNKSKFDVDTAKVHQNIIGNLTDNPDLQNTIMTKLYLQKLKPIEKIFSIRNFLAFDKKCKMLVILGYTIKINCK